MSELQKIFFLKKINPILLYHKSAAKSTGLTAIKKNKRKFLEEHFSVFTYIYEPNLWPRDNKKQ